MSLKKGGPPGMPRMSMAPMPMASMASTSGDLVSDHIESDSYKVVESEINEDQADRMVQKLLKRK